MHRILILLLTLSLLSAEDVLTVEPVTGTVIVGGTTPASPATNKVHVGGGEVKAGGTVTAGDVVINRTGAASGNQAVRGDDVRLSDSRPADGGNADTVDGKHAADFVAVTQKGAADGIAPLDASGKVPVAHLPALGTSSSALCWATAGTYTWTVPADWNAFRVTMIGGGASGYLLPATSGVLPIPARSVGGASGQIRNHTLSLPPGTAVTITIGAGGIGGGAPSSPRLGSGTYVTALGQGFSAGGGGGSTPDTNPGNIIYRSTPPSQIPNPTVGSGGAAGGMGIGLGGAEVAGGQVGLPGVMGGGGSGPSTLNQTGAGGSGCVIIEKIDLTLMP